MKWIKTSERLPDGNIEVLVVVETGIMKLSSKENQIYVGLRISDRDIWLIGDNFGFSVGNVSHWMPLPELPFKEKNNNAANK